MPVIVGDILHYWPGTDEDIPHVAGQPLAAIVTAVDADDRLNLIVFASTGGGLQSRSRVIFIDWEKRAPKRGSYATWPRGEGQ